MNSLIILSLTIAVVFLSWMVVKYSIPPSISSLYYKLESSKKNSGWWFTGFCWAVAFTLLPPWLDMTPENYKFLPFLAGAGLLFVGAAPQFKLQLTGTVHYASAAVCCVASQAWVIAYGYWCVAVASFIIFGYIAYKYNNRMWWIEIASLVSTYATIIFL